MKRLNNLKWIPRWVSHLGCIKGCLNYLNIQVSDAWLYGATGYAFVLNVCGDMCPSGPTDWDTKMFLKLGRNVGYTLEGIFGWKGNRDLTQLQRQAWDHVKNAIDQDSPCYGWELDIPEYYVICGYDDTGLNPLLEKAIEHFEIVSRNLEAVKEAYPFDPELSMNPIHADDRAQSAALALKLAREAEVRGLEALAEIVGCLSE